MFKVRKFVKLEIFNYKKKEKIYVDDDIKPLTGKKLLKSIKNLLE